MKRKMLNKKERNILEIFIPRVKFFGLAIMRIMGMPAWSLSIQRSITATEHDLFPYIEPLVSLNYGKVLLEKHNPTIVEPSMLLTNAN